MIHFYDSATPQNVPSGVYAQVYVNGYTWPEHQIKRMARVYRTSVLREAFWAEFARELDIENGAAQPSDFLAFARHRFALGHHDPTAYVNRSNWQAVKDLVVADLGDWARYVRYRVATLDGTQDIPGVWAVQYRDVDGRYDLSVLHGVNDFTRP